MARTIRARYHQGRIEPLEPLDLEEGAELTVTLPDTGPALTDPDPTSATFGAWKDTIDCEQLEKDIYESRRLQTRPEVLPWSS